MTPLSKNFSLEEFTASATAEKKDIDNSIKDFHIREALDALVDNVLQPLRDGWGKPLNVNSGYRCDKLNKAVGGVPTSQHCKGEAADILCDTPVELAEKAIELKLPYDQMIVYPTFVHFSHKRSGVQRRQLLYNKSYTGRKVGEKEEKKASTKKKNAKK